MTAPPDIIDSLESVIDIFFSGVRHRERAAFILCDNLVEMACKTRAREINNNIGPRTNFIEALRAQGVGLESMPLGSRVLSYNDTRNNMQHASAAATVDSQYCANAILDAARVVDHCWTGTLNSQLPVYLRCGLRVVRLYSRDGDANKREEFERKMRAKQWRGINKRELVRATSKQIELGLRDYWWLAIRTYTPLVEECLNELGIPQ